MAEGPDVARYAQKLRQDIFQNGNPHPPRLANFIRIGNQFTGVNIEDLRSCLDQPLLDIVFKGKDLYLVFQDSAVSPTGTPEIKAVKGVLGVKGKWVLEIYQPNTPVDKDKYTDVHFRIDLSYTPDSMVPELMIFYKNAKYGRIDVLVNKLEFDRAVHYLAPGFLGMHQITQEEWMRKWSIINPNRYFYEVMLDQTKLVSGVGNWVLSELLYQLKCHPMIKMGHFTCQNAIGLYGVLKKLMEDFAVGLRKKVLSKKSLSPQGNPISHEKIFSKPMYWVPKEQNYGNPIG